MNNIKFSGHYQETQKLYDVDETVTFQGRGVVTTVARKTNNDGTYTHVSTLRPEISEFKRITDANTIPTHDKKETTQPKSRSKSKILRSVLHVYWEQQLQGKWKTSDAFYDWWMDTKIEAVKERLR